MLTQENPPSDMPGQNPFQQLFETFGKLPAAHSASVNQEARKALIGCLDVPPEAPGHCILLKAPRAGHGKTHLLTRVQHELGGTHEFIPLQAVAGSRIDAETVLDDTLRRLVRPLPAAGGLTVLDLVARRLFSAALQPLVNSGEVPCQDRESALAALRNRPIETFDFHYPGAVTAHWARENFELLGPRLSAELSQANGLPIREVSFWVDAMFRFAATPIESASRVRALTAVVFEGASSGVVAHDRLVAILGLIGSLMRVILVADELECLSSDEAAALHLASFLGSLRQSVGRADVILSLNQDVWESAFLPRLSDGLADRLSEITIELEPLKREGMIAIIESRSPGMGERILGAMGEINLPTYARGIVKGAAKSWDLEANGFHASAPPITGDFVPPVSELAPPQEVRAGDAPMPEAVSKAPDPIDVPTKFSPEAAIAAFQAANGPAGGPSHSEAAPTASQDTPAWVPPVVPEYVAPQFTDERVSREASPAGGSPFQIDTEAELAVQAFQANPERLSAEGMGGHAPSTDRVDDLLRQFRERYGKS